MLKDLIKEFFKRKLSYLLLVLLIIATVTGLFLRATLYKSKNEFLQSPIPQSQTIEINSFTKLPLSSNNLPQAFPADIPIEKNSQVLRNESFKTSDNKQYFYFSFVSSKSSQENFDLYKDYFMKNNWIFIKNIKTENGWLIITRKDNDLFSINLTPTSTNNSVVDFVLISFNQI